MNLLKCPNCRKELTSKVVRNNGRNDVYCCCGYAWKGQYIHQHEEEINIFYGEWEDYEIIRVLRAIDHSHSCDDDRRFFKGKRLYTMWREGDDLTSLRVFISLEKLTASV